MIGLFTSADIVYNRTCQFASEIDSSWECHLKFLFKLTVMAKIKKPFKQLKKKPGRKVRQKRCQYKLGLKAKVVHWKNVDKLAPKQIRIKVKAELGHDVPASTLSTWWSEKTLANIAEVGPDRTNANDTRRSNTQRPAILIDMEHILASHMLFDCSL